MITVKTVPAKGFRLLAFCFLAFGFAAGAFGYGDEDITGAWADAATPDHPLVVVTNKTAWSIYGGKWIPTFRFGTESHGIRFYTLLSDNLHGRILNTAEGWSCEKMAKEGVSIAPGEVYYAELTPDKTGTDWKSARKMVRTKMPNFSKILDRASYTGYWKPVKLIKPRSKIEIITGEKIENSGLLKIREDMLAVKWQRVHKPSSYNPEPTSVSRLLPVEGWLRIDWRVKNADSRDPLNSRLGAFWINPEGHLTLFNSTDEIMEFVRADETFDDPVEARLQMMREKKYHGVWGMSSEFNTFILMFDQQGKGFLCGGMIGMTFTWTADSQGVIECRLDPDMVELIDEKEAAALTPIRCSFDPVNNEMTTLNVKNPNNGKPRKLKPMPEKSHKEISEAVEQYEKMKKSPEWQQERERIKARGKLKIN